ncbi:Outer membrane protein TolC [Salegentibacter holothuriorum]|uniref:Outer membrane protein TolC n=1 Tax=Salegentibacter holothuriorum TaxID=241145 RepID=A0A1T5DZW3_9FLAO|nr:TolC family protein [Salegentibacter holothuriorum]SKB77332.1 Outer membrane protein TolC [Salegentibacter holothuriorum]
MKMRLLKTKLLCVLLTGLIPAIGFSQIDPVLDMLIQKALEKNHGLNINRLEGEQARIDQKQAKAVFLPEITLNGSYTRLNDDITFDEDTQKLLMSTQKLLIKEAAGLPFNAAFPENIPLQPANNLQNKNILKSSVDVDWVLFSGFEATNARKAGKHKEASLSYAGEAEKDKIVLNLIETYNKLALVNASQEVLAASEDQLRDQERFVKKAIENGLATPISRKKIELAQQQLEGKQLEFKQNKRLLVEVLHQITGENKEVLRSLSPQLSAISSTGSAAEKRAEIQALEEAEKAVTYKSKMEKSNFIPKLALKGHYEFLEDDLSLLDPQWYVGVGIKWNVFDGGKSVLKSRKSQLEAQKYQEQIKEAEEMISLSIVKAQMSYEAALQNTRIAHKEIELAEATFEMLKKQHRNNLASISEVLDGLRDLESANFKLQESYFDQSTAATTLMHAKGILNY